VACRRFTSFFNLTDFSETDLAATGRLTGAIAAGNSTASLVGLDALRKAFFDFLPKAIR